MGSLLLIFANSHAIHDPFLDFQKAVHESDKKNLKGSHPTMQGWLRVLCCCLRSLWQFPSFLVQVFWPKPSGGHVCKGSWLFLVGSAPWRPQSECRGALITTRWAVVSAPFPWTELENVFFVEDSVNSKVIFWYMDLSPRLQGLSVVSLTAYLLWPQWRLHKVAGTMTHAIRRVLLPRHASQKGRPNVTTHSLLAESHARPGFRSVRPPGTPPERARHRGL